MYFYFFVIYYILNDEKIKHITRGDIMIKQNIKFLTTGQFLTFSHTCKNLSSDVRIQDLENHNRVDINGKDLSELATIQLGLPFLLVIHGEDEKMARRMLKKYCA